ncbi:MAG: aspartate kinase [Bacteroidales bacterium]
MEVYKFGGASVKNAEAVKRIPEIISETQAPLVMVVSAMDKTTNALEEIVRDFADGDISGAQKRTGELFSFHEAVISDLMPEVDANRLLGKWFDFDSLPVEDNISYDRLYDMIVPAGELASTTIVAHYLERCGFNVAWHDIRKSLVTDSNFREAEVLFERSERLCKEAFADDTVIHVTQGFIGASEEGLPTTLGREGSDYTAALLASFLGAGRVVLWKDVPGIFNCDPHRFQRAVPIPHLSCHEAIEMTFYGAKVIHPRTIHPLFVRDIPLEVRSFNNPSLPGTTVYGSKPGTDGLQITIRLDDQLLISVAHPGLEFISETDLEFIFGVLRSFRVKVNLLQHEPTGFSICIDSPRGSNPEELIASLQKRFRVHYNDRLVLYTVRNYNKELLESLTGDSKVLLEQRTRNITRLVLRED